MSIKYLINRFTIHTFSSKRKPVKTGDSIESDLTIQTSIIPPAPQKGYRLFSCLSNIYCQLHKILINQFNNKCQSSAY